MHVCMLTDYFLPHLLGGTEKTVYEIGRRIVRRGHRVTVLTLDVNGHERHSQVEGIEIYRIPGFSVTKFLGAQLTVSPSSLPEATRIIAMTQPDIIHAHNLYFNLTAIAPIIKNLQQLPLVTTLHLPKMVYGKALLDFLIQAYEKTIGQMVVQSSDRLIAVSRSVLTYAIADLKASGSKTVLIPNGVDTSVYRPSTKKPESPRITYIGRLVANKGPQYLVRAAPDIVRTHPEVRVQIVGEGPLKNMLMRQVESRGIEDHVQFLGNVRDVLPILQETTIFVRPSLTEGMSLAVLEAMACGLPVIASGVEGNAEIIDDQKTGFLVPPANSKSLVEAIVHLLNDRETAHETGRNARRKVEKLYDWQKIADLTLEVYNR